MVELHRSHRFGAESAIQVFSRGVRSRDIRLARTAWRGTVPGLKLVPTSSAAHRLTALMEKLIPWHQRLLASPSPAAALGVLKELRLLSPLRHGPLGVESLNRDIERRMARQGLIPPGRDWYSGRPVLITSTDVDLGLSNGDTGLALTHPVDGRLLVWFETPDGELRSLSPLRMPPHETAYVMTVHKSQGSEFNEVVLLIPDEPHPLVSREMIYTAVTRARIHAEVWGTEESLLAGLGRATERFSGLGEALWGDLAATERTLRSADHPAVPDSTDT
jgi:exodeoxyribonuclease V alpha subunit